LQLFAVHADGHEFPIEMTLTATDEPGGPVFHAFAHDVTAGHRASRFADVEAAASRGLAEADSSTAAASRVVEALGVKMGWPVAELWLIDDDRQLLVCAARHTTGGRRLGRFAVDELESGTALPGRVHARAQPWWIADLAADRWSLRSRAAARAGLHVAVGVPISTGGRTLGALCVYGDRVEDPEDTLVALLTGIAAQVGQYWERRRAEELTVELARTKDEFLALVTHELRNPLAIITGTAAVLDEDLDTLTEQEQRQYLETICRSATRLSVLADDLLDLARLESGNLAIRPAATDLASIIAAAVDALGAQAADKDLTITADIGQEVQLYADADRLRQVADNLISNSIKYTPAGGRITITATAEQNAGDDAGGCITWTIADTGIGIPPAERPRLFRRFYRASTALDRSIPGTGLGLVITRTIIERHHGSITCAEHTGPGTTFVIRLPVKPPA
ncbi:GAF domain-containing sensor histidine kinase, partial [Actinoplanes sp. NPDC051633]|uniref:GAF domain-containing sensor histidine kinase n=1 Tax=Actinoplanes sp. NPDC051633 TaxID=3155670 RepID=UPI003419A295